MRWLSAYGLAVVALLLLGVMAAPLSAVASAQSANGTGPVDGGSAFNDSQWVVTVYDNGSARWTLRYYQRLRNEAQVQQFRAYAETFTTGKTPIYADFRQKATALTESGANATGRAMAARGFARRARVVSRPSSTGVVETSFLWANFSATSNGEVLVGDAFGSGLYLSPGMSITFKAGSNLDIEWDSVEPTPAASTNESPSENDSVTWFGERQFATGHPRVVFVQPSTVGMGGSSFDGSVVWLAAALAVAVVLGAVVVRRSGRSPFGASATSTADEQDSETASESVTVADEPAETPDESTPATAPEPTVPDEELRGDEEVVRSLLDENDGRMRQSEIVAETGWSKSKVSMLLSEMAEAGDLSKLRVGRENIVSLDGHEPEAAGSPFDEE